MDTNVGAPSHTGVGAWLDANPTLALGGLVVIVLIAGGTLLSKKNAKTGVAGTGSTVNGITTDANGRVIQDLSGLSNGTVYVPTQTTFSTYNATDASQTVSSIGGGNITTGPSSAGNQTTTGASHPGPIKKPPVEHPSKATIVWTQHYITSGQSLDLVAKNASISMRNAANKMGASGMFMVTGQQIYNNNKSAVDQFWLIHKVKGNKTGTNVTGLQLLLPTLTKG